MMTRRRRFPAALLREPEEVTGPLATTLTVENPSEILRAAERTSALDQPKVVTWIPIVGAQVEHDRFGSGRVLEVSETMATVAFDQHGLKKMLISYLRQTP